MKKLSHILFGMGLIFALLGLILLLIGLVLFLQGDLDIRIHNSMIIPLINFSILLFIGAIAAKHIAN